MVEKYTCPCYGYKTLDEQFSWDICPICFWKDDPLKSEKVDLDGGANAVSLRQAQKKFIEFAACEESMIKNVRKPDIYDVKDENWKPLCDE